MSDPAKLLSLFILQYIFKSGGFGHQNVNTAVEMGKRHSLGY